MANVRNHAQWLERYKHLQRFVATHGHALVSRTYQTPDGFKLGIWVSEQRRRKATHSAEEVKLLEALPLWTFNGHLWRWLLGLFEYRAYIAKNRVLDVPEDYVTATGVSLGFWLSTTRQAYTSGALNDEQLRYVEAISCWRQFLDAEANVGLCERQTRRKNVKFNAR